MSLYDGTALNRLIGKTIASIEGMETGSEECKLTTTEGDVLTLRYEQDCCASCDINQIDGDPKDLIGAEIRMAEEIDNHDEPSPEDYHESFTWTFVKFATVKGYVTLRWYGSSNGYYSESPTAYWNGKRDWEICREEKAAAEKVHWN